MAAALKRRGKVQQATLIANVDEFRSWYLAYLLGNRVTPVRAVGTFGFARELRNATHARCQ